MKVYRLKDGMEYSVLKEIPRNTPCLCGSGKKWKKCHMDRLKVTTHQDTHQRLLADWKAGRDTTHYFHKPEEGQADA